MKDISISVALLINAMAIFVLAAAVTTLGPSDPVTRAEPLPSTSPQDERADP